MALAQKASLSTIGPLAPVGGILEANGTVIGLETGIVFNADAFSENPTETNATISKVPPPTAPYNSSVGAAAGGGPPPSYNWTTSISDVAAEALGFLLFVDNLFLDLLVEGTVNLTSGSWSNLYPPTIVDSINVMTVQTYVHRFTSSDSLQHYQKPLPAQCSYSFPIQSVTDWSAIALTVLELSIGSIIDTLAAVAVTDPWLIPVLSSSLGSKSRMAGLVNMMHNNSPSPAVRETVIAPQLAYSYLMNSYVVSGTCKDDLPYKLLPSWTVTSQEKDSSGKLTSIGISLPSGVSTGTLYVAWWGAWGNIEYTPIQNGASTVPSGLYGYVWAVITMANTANNMDTLSAISVTAPEMLWVVGPSNTRQSLM